MERGRVCVSMCVCGGRGGGYRRGAREGRRVDERGGEGGEERRGDERRGQARRGEERRLDDCVFQGHGNIVCHMSVRDLPLGYLECRGGRQG